MVDAERLRRILQHVANDIGILRDYAAMESSALTADRPRLGDTKYTFITAIEGCVDAAQHICSTEGWGPPETNGDAMRLLGSHGSIDPDLATNMARAVGFRNVLVHGYADVDDAIVAENLQRLDELESFVAALARLID